MTRATAFAVVRIDKPRDTDEPPARWIVSAWPDVYNAKHEAQRLEADNGGPHEVVPATITIEETT